MAQAQARRRGALESELLQLLKQSVLGGFIPIKRMSHYAPGGANNNSAGNGSAFDSYITLRGSAQRAPLRVDEELRWESPARKCSVRVAAGRFQWQRDAAGTLLVTNQRILFHAPAQDILWQRSLEKLQAVEAQSVEGVPVVMMMFQDLRNPVGFEVPDVQWDIVLDDRPYTLTFTARELVELIVQEQLAAA